MILPLAPRTHRAALLGVVGALALTGCGPAGSEDTEPADGASVGASASTNPGGRADAASYTDGAHTASGSYVTPESVETIEVTITLESDVITGVEVRGDPQARESREYQSRFIGGISDEVVGRDIDDIEVSRVAGSSLTSGGFNEAVKAIKDEAAA